MKKSRLLGIVFACSVFIAGPTNASIVITDQVQTQYDADNQKIGITVDFWSFSTTGGTLIFNIYAWMYGDPSNYLDSNIWLFTDDGALDTSDLIAQNDDYDGAGWDSDGSTNTLDSYLSIPVTAGNYILAVGDCCDPTAADIIDGLLSIGFNNPNPIAYVVDNPYQLTITGDVSIVPLPSVAWLFSSGLLGLIGIVRFNKSA